MNDVLLVVNAGSSSLKFSLFRIDEIPSVQTRGQVEAIGTDARLVVSHGPGSRPSVRRLPEVRDLRGALTAFTEWLSEHYRDGMRLRGVGHRVVHGGVKYVRPVRISDHVLADLHELVPLAPLHQPNNLGAIEAVIARFPDVPQVACFDTSFHRDQSRVAQLIPLPREVVLLGVRRYGFHGLSYESVASVLPERAPEVARGRVVVAHLGSGASLCAMKDGKSVDSSFSFTALDGLCMATRPGALDPGVVLYLFQNLGLSAKDVETMLYRRSGLLGISGLSADMRDLLASDHADARLAIDYFVYRAMKELGGQAAVLGGIDGLVFTGGIGENAPDIRERICLASAWLGIDLDRNANARGDARITTPQSRVSVWVIPTDEERMIARHTIELLEL